MSGASTPAGWYPDPQNPAQQRYWDGTAWSEATQPAPPVVPPPPPMGAYAPPPPGYGAPGYGAPGYGPPGYGAPGYGQPMGYGMAAAGPPPQNYLVFAILSTVFCCLPAGIVAIVKAASVNGKWNAGDYAGAQAASRQARGWAVASALVGLVVIVLYVATFNVDSTS